MNLESVLDQAVNCERNGRLLEAQSFYKLGIKLLQSVARNGNKRYDRSLLQQRQKVYEDRLVHINNAMMNRLSDKEKLDEFTIPRNATGQSYYTIFSNYLGPDIKEVLIEEPLLYQINHHRNLIKFLELIVRKCPLLSFVCLVTRRHQGHEEKQAATLNEIVSDLAKRNIIFDIKYDNQLCNRRIVLGSKFIVEISRGLHYHRLSTHMKLGLTDYDFRKCLKTKVNIWRVTTKSSLRKSNSYIIFPPVK